MNRPITIAIPITMTMVRTWLRLLGSIINTLPTGLGVRVNPLEHLIDLLQRLVRRLLEAEDRECQDENIEEAEEEECGPAYSVHDVWRCETPDEIEEPL